MSDSLVYLDYAASAPLRPEARAAEAAWEQTPWAGANPNSLHTPGRKAAQALEQARATVVRAVGGRFRPAELTFTSGGTEANNLAILGIARAVLARHPKRNRIIVSAIEHESVLALRSVCEKDGFIFEEIRPNRSGVVEPATLQAALDTTCAVVSIMSVNNELGTIQPIEALAEAAHAVGAYFHTDAVQALGRTPLAAHAVDALSCTAHKLGGPVGIGALLVRGNIAVQPQQLGGGQERGRRSGTQDVRGAQAFAAVARLVTANFDERMATLRQLDTHLREQLFALGTDITPTTSAKTIPGLISLIVEHGEAQSLLLALDQRGFAVSMGSACGAASDAPSHVLTAMGLSRQHAQSVLRVSFDERVAPGDLDRFAATLCELV